MPRLTPNTFEIKSRFANRVIAQASRRAVASEVVELADRTKQLVVTFDDGSTQTTHEYDRR